MTESRVKKMPDKEFGLPVKRLGHQLPEKPKYFYRHLQADNMIHPVDKYIDANLHIRPEDVLKQIKKRPRRVGKRRQQV